MIGARCSLSVLVLAALGGCGGAGRSGADAADDELRDAGADAAVGGPADRVGDIEESGPDGGGDGGLPITPGRNPDIAVGGAGYHIVFMRGSQVMYREPRGAEVVIGTGRDEVDGDPHIALDGEGVPHFAWGGVNVIKYRKSGGSEIVIRSVCGMPGFEPPTDYRCIGMRKPRIAISGNQGFVMFEDRWAFAVRIDVVQGSVDPEQRMLIAPNTKATYDTGGVAVDAMGNGYFTARRSSALYYCRIPVGQTSCAPWKVLDGGPASDFSDVAYDDGTVHISALAGVEGGAIRYITVNAMTSEDTNRNLPTGASCVGKHDNVGSGIGVAAGRAYIAWSSGNAVSRAWWFAAPADEGPRPITDVARSQGTKFTFPEVDGSWVVWEGRRGGVYGIYARDLSLGGAPMDTCN